MRERRPESRPDPSTRIERDESRRCALPVADLPALQRSAGNQAVTRWVQQRRSVQRNEQSAKRLAGMTAPQIFPGPEVEAQDAIAIALDKQLDGLEELAKIAHGVTCLGGIKLTNLRDDDVRALIDRSELKPMAKGKTKVEPSTFAIAHKAGVTKDIVVNTLRTMEAAGQLAYLRESGLLRDDWAVVIEIHYYYDRPPTATRFHKDTEGQTLFVNLNYMNDEPIAGPEWIVNPHTPQAQADQRAQTLPKVFRDDLAQATRGMPEGGEVGTQHLPRRGVVSFVDEAMHHKTPTLRHRVAVGDSIKAALEAKFALPKGLLDTKFQAYKDRGTASYFSSFSTYLKEVKPKDAEKIHKILKRLSKDGDLKGYNRHELAEFIPDGYLEIDRLVALDEPQQDFATAGVPYMPMHQRDIPLQSPDMRPLKREMSGLLDQPNSVEAKLKRDKDARAKGEKAPPRRFFRTWVRAVPRKDVDSYFAD